MIAARAIRRNELESLRKSKMKKKTEKKQGYYWFLQGSHKIV